MTLTGNVLGISTDQVKNKLLQVVSQFLAVDVMGRDNFYDEPFNSAHPSADCSRHLNLPSLFPVLTIVIRNVSGFYVIYFLLWE